jgi:hypothetical protein
MADKDPLRQAVETAWSVYRAMHNDIHESDERQCLLERHLQQSRRRERMILKS